MSFWKKLFVVLPAFVILHLVATGAAQLAEGLRGLWQPGAHDETYLLAAFPIGYAMGVAMGLAAAPGLTRRLLATALILSTGGLYGFAELANGYAGGSASLAFAGFAAGLALPVAGRALGLVGSLAAGGALALLTAAVWWLSVPFVGLFKQGLPVSGMPGWAAPYLVQGVLCVLWLLPVLFLGGERPGRRR